MKLASRTHTIGDTTLWTVDYSGWLEHGVTIANLLLTCTDTSVTLGSPIISDGNRGKFTVAGGTLNQSFTIVLVMQDSKGGVKNDSIDFSVVSP
jgi:hypothetical protein